MTTCKFVGFESQSTRKIILAPIRMCESMQQVLELLTCGFDLP